MGNGTSKPFGANVDARLALDTAVRKQRKNRSAVKALRVVAPGTIQGASFEKDRRADSRAVMDGESLYVEDDARQHFKEP
jgi:hypothetical protein